MESNGRDFVNSIIIACGKMQEMNDEQLQKAVNELQELDVAAWSCLDYLEEGE